MTSPIPNFAADAHENSLPPLRISRVRNRHSRKSYYAVVHSKDSATYPRLKPLGYLRQSRLIAAAQAGDLAARNVVWLQHARLAITALNRHRVPVAECADALQAAQLGLLRSIAGFEVARLNEFSTYAFHWIAQAIRRFRMRSAHRIPIPAYMYKDFVRYCRDFPAGQHGNDWYDAWDRWRSSSPREYKRLKRIHSLAQPTKWSRAIEPTTFETDPLSQLMETEAVLTVRRAVRLLDERQQRIITARYGLNGSAEYTLKDIGDQIGLTRERVRQLQVKAEECLRKHLLDLMGSHESQDLETAQTTAKN